jgi:hypothetical protein
MQFSCKITNSVLSYLQKNGGDAAAIFSEGHPLTEDVLRDPNCWANAADVESFLEQLVRSPIVDGDENFLQKAGHEGPHLRSWGVLDSVLRMMPRPQEIFSQPERFLSYFIAPQPPIANLIRTEDRIEFDWPIHAEQFPRIATFLQAAFESLPLYVGKPMGTCKWEGMRLRLEWNNKQESIFNEDQLGGHQLSPELLRSIVATLGQQSTPIEAKVLSQSPLASHEFIDDQKTEKLRDEISRLSDYMVRAQQLITLLVGQDRMNAGIKEAMRRVDWERVQKQFPKTVEECRKLLDRHEISAVAEQENLNV